MKRLNPQQETFLAGYVDPESPTFGNALQSALNAGYAQEYAENILHLFPDWLSEKLGDTELLNKAERVLHKTLDLEAVNEEGNVDSSLLRVQVDVAKFSAERLNKAKYSTRTEHTGKDGEPITIEISEAIAKKNGLDTKESS